MEKEIKSCNQWHTLPSEVMAKQMTTQHSSNSLFVPIVVWIWLSSALSPTIHTCHFAALSSIFEVVSKVHALHFVAQPP